jgi:hypothetical protein
MTPEGTGMSRYPARSLAAASRAPWPPAGVASLCHGSESTGEEEKWKWLGFDKKMVLIHRRTITAIGFNPTAEHATKKVLGLSTNWADSENGPWPRFGFAQFFLDCRLFLYFIKL